MLYLICAAGLTGLYYCLATLRLLDKNGSRSYLWWAGLIGTAWMTGTVLRVTIFLLCLFG